MPTPTQLYMFAIMPPPDLSARIHNERLAFAEQYKFVKALKPPVHITLYPPFQIRIADVSAFEEQISKIQNWASSKAPFYIELNNYGYFENFRSPVLYIDVLRSVQLIELHTDFLKELEKYIDVKKKNDRYNPHITIGYRDIDPGVFPAIKTAYSKRVFKATFPCSTFHLWKHDGQNWQVLLAYRLKGIER